MTKRKVFIARLCKKIMTNKKYRELTGEEIAALKQVIEEKKDSIRSTNGQDIINRKEIPTACCGWVKIYSGN